MEILQLNQIESINSGRGELITNPKKGDKVVVFYNGTYVEGTIFDITGNAKLVDIFVDNKKITPIAREVYTLPKKQGKYCEKELDKYLKNYSSEVDRKSIRDRETKKNLSKVLTTQNKKGNEKVHSKKLVVDQTIALELLSMAKRRTEKVTKFIQRTRNSLVNAYTNDLNCIFIGTSGKDAELALFPSSDDTDGFTYLNRIKEIIDSNPNAWLDKVNNGEVKISVFEVTVNGIKKNICVLVTDKNFLHGQVNKNLNKGSKDNYIIQLRNHYSHIPNDLLSSCFVNFNIHMAYLYSLQQVHRKNLFFERYETYDRLSLECICSTEIDLIILKTIACSLSVIDLKLKHQLLDFNAYFDEDQKREDEEKHNEAQRKSNAQKLKEANQRLAMANGYIANGYLTGGTYAPSTNKYIEKGQQSIMSTNMGGYLHVGGLYMI